MDDDAEPGPVEEGGDGSGSGTEPVAEVVAGGSGDLAGSDGADTAPLTDAPLTDAPPTDGTTEDPDDGSEVRDPLRFNNWMKRSATGAVMTGIAVGLQQALQLPRQEPAFVIEASGEPHDPNHPIDLHFDPDNPADTVAIIRRPPPVAPPEDPSPPA